MVISVGLSLGKSTLRYFRLSHSTRIRASTDGISKIISNLPLLVARREKKLLEKNMLEIPERLCNCDEFAALRNGPPLCNLLLLASQ